MRGFVFCLLLVLMLGTTPALFAADATSTEYQSPYRGKTALADTGADP